MTHIHCNSVTSGYGGAASHFCTPSHTLPFTGLNLLVWLVVAAGIVAVGLYLRHLTKWN